MPPRPELHRGKLAKHPKVLGIRPLAREDLSRLAEKRVGPPRMKAYREAHHRVARLYAAGLRPNEISRRTGYSPQRLGQLRNDPAFEQLIAEYREKVDQAWIDSLDEFYETSTSNMLRAERMVEAHLDEAEDTGELIPLKTLVSITADRADRFGYGKHVSQTTEVLNFAQMMEEMARRSGRSNVIDAKAEPTAAQPFASSPEGLGSLPDSRESPPAPSASVAVGFRRR